jgi:membrane protein insertase Oxa1/YidC/SpoIIIJ
MLLSRGAARLLRAPRRFATSSAAAAAAAASSAAPPGAAPAAAVLDAVARATPGTALYGAPRYGAGTDAPYPLYWLDPDGAPYRAVLGVATRSADVISALHETLGLPWWGTIFAVGALIRVAMLPLSVHSLRNASRAADARDDIAALRRAYQRATLAGAAAPLLAEKAALLGTLARGVRASLHKAGCFPWQSLCAPLVQVPFVVAAVLGARHAVLLGDASFETGGALWFADLTSPDPYYVLPMASIALAYASVEVIFRERPAAPRPGVLAAAAAAAPRAAAGSGGALLLGNFGSYVKGALQMWMILALPYTIEYPAGLYVLMASSSTWSMAFVTLMRDARVYKAITGRDAPGAAPAVPAFAAPPAGAAPAPALSLTVAAAPPAAAAAAAAAPPPVAPPPPSAPFAAAAAATTAALSGRFFRAAAAPRAAEPVLAAAAQQSLGAGGAAELSMQLQARPSLALLDDDDDDDATAAAAAAAPPPPSAALRADAAAPPSSADTAAQLQRTPRFVYYAARDIDLNREGEDLLLLRRTLNANFPIVSGANALMLRMAGGLPSAPWSAAAAAPVAAVAAATAAAAAAHPHPATAAAAAAALDLSVLKAALAADGAALEGDGGGAEAYDADHVQVLSAAFEHLWLGSTFVVLPQPVPGKPQRSSFTKEFVAAPWTGVANSHELPPVGPNQRERARAVGFPAAASWLAGPPRLTLDMWHGVHARRRARDLVGALAAPAAPGAAASGWAPLRARRGIARVHDGLRGERGERAAPGPFARAPACAFAPPAPPPKRAPTRARKPRSGDEAAAAALRTELLALMRPPLSADAAATFAARVAVGREMLGGADDDAPPDGAPAGFALPDGPAPLQPRELVFFAGEARADAPRAARGAGSAAAPAQTPLAAQAAAHADLLEARARWAAPPRAARRLNAEQRADFDKTLLFSRAREGASGHAFFLPRAFAVTDAGGDVSGGGSAFISGVAHAVGGARGP